jgi:hypothetical protein
MHGGLCIACPGMRQVKELRLIGRRLPSTRARRKADGATVSASQFQLSVHTDTHTDAPFHFDDAGAKPDYPATPAIDWLSPRLKGRLRWGNPTIAATDEPTTLDAPWRVLSNPRIQS